MCQGRSLQATDCTWRGRRQLGAHAFSTVHVKAELRDAQPIAQAALRNESSRLSQTMIWFQLANIRVPLSD
jgi:hypothetical protein